MKEKVRGNGNREIQRYKDVKQKKKKIIANINIKENPL